MPQFSTDKNTAFLGDTWNVSVICTKRAPSAPLTEVVAVPESASVTVYDELKKSYLELGGAGIEEGTGTIEGRAWESRKVYRSGHKNGRNRSGLPQEIEHKSLPFDARSSKP